MKPTSALYQYTPPPNFFVRLLSILMIKPTKPSHKQKPSEQELRFFSQGQLPDGWQWVASSPATKVAYNKQANTYYKEFLSRSKLENIKALFRGSRCSRAVELSLILKAENFNTPAVICSGKLDNQCEYMVTAAASAVGVASYMASYMRGSNNTSLINWKRAVIRALGREVGRLHSAKIIHGDLRPNNVLIELGTEKPSFYFIDNERTRRWPWSPAEKSIRKNLLQIGMLFPVDISKTDRLRFWKSYCMENSRYSPYNTKRNIAFGYAVTASTLARLNTTPHYQPREADLPQEYLKNGLVVPADHAN